MEHKQGENLSEKTLEELAVQGWVGISLRHTRSAGSIENRHSATLPFARSSHLQHRQGWEI